MSQTELKIDSKSESLKTLFLKSVDLDKTFKSIPETSCKMVADKWKELGAIDL